MRFEVQAVDIRDRLVSELIFALTGECFKPEGWEHNRIPRWHDGQWFIVFALTRGKRIEAAFGGIRPSVRYAGTGYMNAAGVLPAYRGRGLQRRLIRRRLEYARERGWKWVITDTLNDNAASMTSLIACGFRPYSPAVRWASEAAVYWRRRT